MVAKWSDTKRQASPETQFMQASMTESSSNRE